MHVQDLKRWHWVVIALVVGLALSYVWSSVEWDENLPTIGQRDFESGLITPYPREKHLANVTVMPPHEGKYKVVAEQVRNTKTPGVIDLRPVAFMADTPYKDGAWRGDSVEHASVREYLKAAKANNAEISFKYAWYRETWAIYLLWTGASLLLIGGVWPSVVSLMVGAGLGFQGEEKGPEYDLSRFKAEAEKKKAAGHVPTEAELAHLHELEDELEKKLAAQRAGMPIPEDEPQTVAAVKKLDGGPLEAMANTKGEEEHDYKGEFYPVDRHLPKKK
jgi:hypothetical protein